MRTFELKGRLHGGALALALLLAQTAAGSGIVLENASCRLVLAREGYATSLVIKATGEECLQPGVRLPLCTLTQYRPYDNENFLTYPAKPTTYPANRIEVDGDDLLVSFEGTADIARLAVTVRDAYIGVTLKALDFRIEDFGVKRKTETDEFALLRLPVAKRAHFGSWLNVMWDDRSAVALLAGHVETRVDAFPRDDGAYEFFAGLENRVRLEGAGAVLVATARPKLFDAIAAVERDYGMPDGVTPRLNPGMDASFYWAASVTPTNVDRHVAAAKAGGFTNFAIYYDAFASTCGHYAFRKDLYPRGLDDLKTVTGRIRAAGLVPGLHFHFNKVSVDDAYVVGNPDPRLDAFRHLLLAKPVSRDDTTIYLQGNPAGILVEPVAASALGARENERHLVQIGSELIRYAKAVTTPPYRLEGCRRGALGTRPAAHTADERFRHLNVDDWPRFIRVDQDTDLQDEIAARLAGIIHACGFRHFHYDGAEDVSEPYWYNVPRAQTRMRRAIGDTQIWGRSASHVNYSWHSITHGCGFDMFPHERVREAVRRYWTAKSRELNENFTTTDYGSLDLRVPDELREYADGTRRPTTAMQPDHAEFTFSKSYAWDGCSGVRVYHDRELDHPRLADILAVMRRWEEIRKAQSLGSATKEMLKDCSREWFVWPFGFDARHPVLVEYRQVTRDEERPLRAFSYRRGGRAGLVYWTVNAPATPELSLSFPGERHLADGGRRFLEADATEAELVRRFRQAGKNRIR